MAVILFVAGYGRISSETDKELAIRLTKRSSVATIPVSSFYHNGKDDKSDPFLFQ